MPRSSNDDGAAEAEKDDKWQLEKRNNPKNLADMTIEEIVKFFISKTVNTHGGKASNYYCGMTNNRERRRMEHGVSELLCSTECSDKECARNLMRQLAEAGFDVDKDIMSGQDDSIHVYVYKKSRQTKECLTKIVSLKFQKRWYDEGHLEDLPNTNGIYCCYACDKKLINHTYQNSTPLYIGLASNGFYNRIVTGHKPNDHDKWKENQQLGEDRQLVYAIAEFDTDILQTVESALIYKNQTPENIEYKEGYQGEYHSIIVNCEGYKADLKDSITATFGEK